MKCIAILSIMAVLLSDQVLSREYILEPNTEPLSSRMFGFFNLLNQNRASTSTRLTSMESAVAPIISGFANLQNQVAALITRLTADEVLIAQAQATIAAQNIRLTADEALIAAAQNAIAALQAQAATSAVAKCPSTAPASAQIVMGKCYSVFSNNVTFASAQATCNQGVGKLAEPAAQTATALYTELKTAFQPATNIIAGNGTWIGVVQAPGGVAGSPFFFTSNPGTPVANSLLTNSATLPAPGATVNLVAFLATTNPLVAATPFTAIDSTPTTTAPTKGFICQYT